MSKSRLFLFFVVSFLYGIFLSVYFWIFGAILLFIFVFLYGRIAVLWIHVYIILSLVLGVMFWHLNFYIPYEKYEGEYSFNGCIVGEVDVRDSMVNYVFDLDATDYEDYGGKILVSADRYPIYKYGDCFFVSGKLAGIDLDESYGRYLARYDIYGVMFMPKLVKSSSVSGNFFMKFLYFVKGVFYKRMNEIFPEPFAGFLGGLLLGSRGGIGKDLLNKFSVVGLTHIIAISGYNITIIINLFGFLFGFLKRNARIFVSTIFIFIFVLLVGGSSSVVRAALMGTISLMAIVFERQYFCFLALMLTAFFMTLINPKILVYDVGFQLSFLATAGMIFFTDKLEKYFLWVPKRFLLRENLVITLSAQIFTAPLILLYFGRFSWVSIFANLLVLPFIPFAMLFGFLAVILSFFSSGFGVFVGFFGFLCLKLIIIFVDIFVVIA